MPLTLQALAERIQAELHGDGALSVQACAPIETAGPHDVAFVANAQYFKHLATTKAGAVIVSAAVKCPPTLSRLVVRDPYFGFREAMVALHGFRVHPDPMEAEGGVSMMACIHPEATIGEGCRIHPYAVVERSAKIGARSVLYPGVYIGIGAEVGEDCVLFPNTAVYDRCVLGNRVTLHSSTVIGQDGFGYATHRGAHHKIPQSGNVVIEDDVELGAGCAVERAAMGSTRIGAGTKFADLISIGHGTTIGKHCLFVSLVGVSGSVEMGDYVVLGGQVGISGHLTIGDRVQVAGKAGVVDDIAPGMKVGGAPAIDQRLSVRNALIARDLHSLVKRIQDLEKEVAALQMKEV